MKAVLENELKKYYQKTIRPRMDFDLPDEQTVHQITKIKPLGPVYMVVGDPR